MRNPPDMSILVEVADIKHHKLFATCEMSGKIPKCLARDPHFAYSGYIFTLFVTFVEMIHLRCTCLCVRLSCAAGLC